MKLIGNLYNGMPDETYKQFKVAILSSLVTAILFLLPRLLCGWFPNMFSGALSCTTNYHYHSPSHFSSRGMELSVCAPFVKRSRKVAMAGFSSWDEYQSGWGYNGGENYWAASLHYILMLLKFEVEFVDYEEFLKNRAHELRDGLVHRLIVNDPASLQHPQLMAINDSRVTCRVRALNYWCNWKRTDQRIDPRQIISPFPDRLNTPIPFFVHSLVTLSSRAEAGYRGRRCYILGKGGAYFKDKQVRSLLHALAHFGFEMHTTCTGKGCWMPPHGKVVRHNKMQPIQFSRLLQDMAFIVGLGDPKVSPTPLEGLAAGAAFLNPLLNRSNAADYGYSGGRMGVNAVKSQHAAIAMLGAPYVYNYDISDPSTLITVAERAVRYRFESFVPSTFSVEGVASFVCAGLLETHVPCTCQNERHDDTSLDCRGSLYTTVNGHGDGYTFMQDYAE